MTDDPRAAQFRDAALRMKERQFPVRVEVGGDDEMASLGRALHDLGRTLERSYREADLLLDITRRISAGFLLEEVLGYVDE